jgi:cytochrome b
MKNPSFMSKLRVKTWDEPTRLVHWLLAILVGISWWTGKTNRLDIHRLSGYAILGLVLFRVIWGFVGGSTARFKQFVRGPRALISYARREMLHRGHVAFGHNPMGGWSVLAMLGLLLTQTVSGLFAVDVDGIESGPLSYLVTFDRGRQLAHLHRWTFNCVLALLVLHICAIAFYSLYKREGLVAAMLGGYKRFPAQVSHQPVGSIMWWRVIVAAIVAALIAVGASAGFRISF